MSSFIGVVLSLSTFLLANIIEDFLLSNLLTLELFIGDNDDIKYDDDPDDDNILSFFKNEFLLIYADDDPEDGDNNTICFY